MRQLAGTWTLISIERPGTGGRLASLPFPRGLLVFDSAGHVFEGVRSRGTVVTLKRLSGIDQMIPGRPP